MSVNVELSNFVTCRFSKSFTCLFQSHALGTTMLLGKTYCQCKQQLTSYIASICYVIVSCVWPVKQFVPTDGGTSFSELLQVKTMHDRQQAKMLTDSRGVLSFPEGNG